MGADGQCVLQTPRRWNPFEWVCAGCHAGPSLEVFVVPMCAHRTLNRLGSIPLRSAAQIVVILNPKRLAGRAR